MKCYEFYTLALSNNLLRSIKKSQLVHDKVTRLDLSVNLISYAERNVFENMPCLEFIDLRYNPIQFIHYYAFKSNKHLKHLDISSTYIISNMYLLYFLEHLNDFVEITLTFVDDNFFRLLYKASTYRITVNSVKKS